MKISQITSFILVIFACSHDSFGKTVTGILIVYFSDPVGEFVEEDKEEHVGKVRVIAIRKAVHAIIVNIFWCSGLFGSHFFPHLL